MDHELLNRAAAQELRGEMAAQGVTQRDMSDATGVSMQTVIRYVRGERPMPLAFVVSALDRVGMDIATFWRRVQDRLG